MTSLVTDIITPIIALASGKNLEENFLVLRKNSTDLNVSASFLIWNEMDGMGWDGEKILTLFYPNFDPVLLRQYPTRALAQSHGEITWNWGNFLQTVINFFIVSGCVFLIVKRKKT